MEKMLEYKGYVARVKYDPQDMVWYGKIEGIKDLVNFESELSMNIEREFHSAVDDYLALLKEEEHNRRLTESLQFMRKMNSSSFAQKYLGIEFPPFQKVMLAITENYRKR